MRTVGGGPNIVTDGLVLHFDAANTKCYDNSISGNTIWNDLSKNQSKTNTTILNGTFDTNNNGALLFSATSTSSSSYIHTPTFNYLNNDVRTFEFVLKCTGVNNSTHMSICGQFSTAQNMWLFFTDNTTVQYAYRGTDGVYKTFNVLSGPNILLKWQIVTFVFNSNNVIDFYYNGVYNSSVSASTTDFVLKGIAGGYQSGGSWFSFNGYWANTKIYNRTLTSTEIMQNFNAIRGRYGL